jgi:hypothetical protein
VYWWWKRGFGMEFRLLQKIAVTRLRSAPNGEIHALMRQSNDRQQVEILAPRSSQPPKIITPPTMGLTKAFALVFIAIVLLIFGFAWHKNG